MLWFVFLHSFLAATLFPVASEPSLIYALEKGESLALVFLVASVGNTLGSFLGYALGRLGKLEWLHKYFRVKEQQIFQWKQKVQRFQYLLGFLGWVPIVGDPLVIALGYFKASYWCLLSIFIGKLARYGLLLYLYSIR